MLAKKLLTALAVFMAFSVMAQTSDTTFKKEWVEIDSLIIKQNLPKTALEKVNALYKKAAAKKLDVQLIKCLVYRVSLEDRVNDNKPNAAINTLQIEIGNTKNETAKAILYSLLANRYLQYYNNNRYRLYERSKTTNFKKEDIETWNADDFGNAISEYYTKSMGNAKLLQQTSLTAFDAIILKGNARRLRPTLFDLLAHEALDYFKSGDYYLTKPSYAFELKNIDALAPAKTFLQSTFKTKDTASHLLKSLLLFKQLIQFHLNDEDKNALIDVDLERVQWVYNNLTDDHKEEQYIATLETIASHTESRAAQASYLLAQQASNKAFTYQPLGDTTQRFGYIKALNIIDKALTKHKAADEGTSNMKLLRNEILQQSINIQTEQVNVPNQPFRALVSYRNIDTLFVRLIKIETGNEKYFARYGTDFKALAKQKPYTSFQQVLPPTNDHQTHSVEIKLDALPVGEYILLTSSGAGFVDSLHKMSNQVIYVSNISYIKNGSDYFVLHRETGEPLQNVKVQVYKETWNSKKQKNETTIVAEKSTDKDGYFRFLPKETNNDYEFVFTSSNDRLHLRDKDYITYSRDNEDDKGDYYKNKIALYEADRTAVYFFTDRGIYRPGQTIYFKGIAITQDYTTGLSKVIANKKNWKVYLQDVHEKTIDSVTLTTNDYGSFNATFKIPENVLPGLFILKTDKGQTSFSVEEYKRPKYYVEFEKVKGNYRLNDSVTVTGIAKAYAGNAIDGAKVKFNIQRNTRFIYDWLWRGRNTPNSEGKEIDNGEIVTDAAGKFKITFKASADEKLDKNTDPLFNFSITADVTDINGETRSGNTLVTVGYKSLVLNATVPELASADSVQRITITTKNLSDEHEPADVTVKIYPLQPPQRLIRRSLWPRADQFVMNKETYIHYFPHDDYADELNEGNWKEGHLLFEQTINTKDTSTLLLPVASFKAGYYKIEATTKDRYGNAIKDVQYMELFGKDAIAYPQYNFKYAFRNEAEPNDTVAFIAGSMADKVYVVQRTATPTTKPVTTSFIRNKGLHNIQYKVNETDRGNVAITEAFVINNRFYTHRFEINVPFSNKVLNLTYASYRNKTEPGNKETWTVSIKGSKGEKVAAELLTSMYDASLDQFTSHDWYRPNIWKSKYHETDFQNGIGFNTSQSNENYFLNKEKRFAVVYDRLVKNSVQLNRVQPLWWLNPGDAAYRDFNESSKSAAGNNKLLMSTRKLFNGSTDMLELKSLPSASISAMGNVSVQYEMSKFTSPKIVKDEDGTIDKPYAKQFEQPKIQPRKNFNETAFFFPNLYADTSGNYTFSFTIPEALTQWKWQSLAHTKDLSFGSNSTTIITQKTLMVQPNAPRFMREGDNLEFVTKIVNLSNKELTGQATLELVDAATGTSVDGWFQNVFPNQYFTVAAGQSASVKFPVQVPFNYNKPLTWRVIAKAGDYSDGEENTLPVLTNRMLVTETLPLYMKPGNKEKTFTFDKLLNNKSESLSNESITVEYTANPIWNAVQALPYLMEYPYECAEQTFNRFYANALAANIVNKYPKIKNLFDAWEKDSTAFKSNLQQNEELKQVLLQETPWVLNAQNEVQQQKNIAQLFNMAQMGTSIDAAIQKLQQMQMESGGFAWFKGGREDRYITNYILTGIGRMKKMNCLTQEQADNLFPIFSNGLNYLDNKLKDDYNNFKKNKADLTKQQITSTQIQYLYMRSFFVTEIKNKEAYNYYYNQAKQFWNKQNSYNAAMIGLVLNRNSESKFVTANILPSITENAIEDTAKGTVYWKDRNTCFWYASPIEHQSMMIELLSEASDKTSLVDAAKTWLILNKQANNWKTTVATADACYALLNTGSNWIDNNQQVQIKLGSIVVQQATNQQPATNPGYIKQRIEGDKVKPSMGNIIVTTNQPSDSYRNNPTTSQPSYGAVYWQYFEDLDKITEATSPLSLKKKLFIETNTANGKLLQPVSDTNQLKVGDKLIVRIELRSDREMQYLHLKDMRASGTEPVNTLSSYKWQDNLGYYEATKDASTNFFIDRMQKGVYVFEYPLYVTHTGTFSVGIATIQCMYAPEFTSHSEGIKITVKE